MHFLPEAANEKWDLNQLTHVMKALGIWDTITHYRYLNNLMPMYIVGMYYL